MNYEAHFNSVFTTPELAEDFLKEVMKQLNDITFNGANKIDKVSSMGGSVVVRTPKYKKCELAHYYFRPSRASKVTLD